MLDILLYAAILSILPIAELRGGIPYAVGSGVDIVTAFIVCVAANMLVPAIVYVFLETLHKLLYKITVYQKVFDKFIERTRKKAEKNIGRYGYWGVMLFVAIPLPITGAYNGTLAAWLMRLNKRKSYLYLVLGVVIAGIIVSVATLTGIGILQIFLKK